MAVLVYSYVNTYYQAPGRVGKMSQLMRLWYLSYRRQAKAQASLRIRMEVDEGFDQKSDI